MTESFIFLLKCIILLASIKFKVLSKFVFICFHQSAFNLAAALENQVCPTALELARL